MERVLKIEGMSCKHCVNAVKNALNAIDGVNSAEVDLEKKTAIVEASDKVTDDMLREAVEEEGYTVV